MRARAQVKGITHTWHWERSAYKRSSTLTIAALWRCGCFSSMPPQRPFGSTRCYVFDRRRGETANSPSACSTNIERDNGGDDSSGQAARGRNRRTARGHALATLKPRSQAAERKQQRRRQRIAAAVVGSASGEACASGRTRGNTEMQHNGGT